MLTTPKTAWLAAFRFAQALPGIAVVCGAVLLVVSVAAAYFASRDGWMPWVMTLAWLLAMVWAQAVIVRLMLRHLAIGDDGGLVALRPGRTLRAVAGAAVLTQIMAAGPAIAMLPLIDALEHEIGRPSALLTIPLLVPLALLSAACGLRFMLAAAPAALGLSAPLDDSWEMTDGHALEMAAGAALTLLPPAVVLAGMAWLLARGMVILPALGLTLGWLALSGALAGLVLGFYRRWKTELRPDMRPSRNRARRLEPVLEWLAGKTNALRRMAGPNDR